MAAAPAIKPQYADITVRGVPRSLAFTLTSLNSETSDTKENENNIFVVFVNGLGLPQAFWQPCIAILREGERDLAGQKANLTLLTYDRIGQGLSQRPDAPPPEPHDLLSAADELHAMICMFRPPEAKIFLVGQSIGGPLTRLYIQHYPGVSALLLLDSNVANSDFVSMYPDPDGADFTPDELPDDTSVDQLREARARVKAMFHPSVVNAERLQRSNIASLLPDADRPVLQGASEGRVLLNVVGHGPDAFAEESLKISPKGLTTKYVEPVWQKYNAGLLGIGDSRRGKVVLAEGAGHFIQKDRPDLVAGEIREMVSWLVT